MKSLIMLLAIVAYVGQVRASDVNCSITVAKVKTESKSGYLANGESVTDKAMEKFKGVCTVNVRVMSAGEKRAIDIKKAELRLAKLKAQAAVK